MSQPRPVGASVQPSPQVEAALSRASRETGIDFAYLLGEARLESSLNPNARAGTSSAAGLFQFTDGTWLSTLDRHGAQYGFGWASDAIVGGKVRDPAMRAQVMALRFDPQASALMAAELAGDNRDFLRGVLGRDPDASELYLAHFLGADGAGKFLTALAADPTQSAAALFPKAAAANRAIFFTPSGQPRSLGEVMGLLRTKMAGAMSDFSDPVPNGDGAGWGASGWSPVANADATHPPASYGNGGPEPGSARPSMADTLAATFGGNPAAMPGHVRSAYGKLRTFGL